MNGAAWVWDSPRFCEAVNGRRLSRMSFAEARDRWERLGLSELTLFCELVTGYRVRPPMLVKGWNPTHGWDPGTMRWPERPAAVQERLL